jgi:hypothetical protein
MVNKSEQNQTNGHEIYLSTIDLPCTSPVHTKLDYYIHIYTLLQAS